MKAICIRLMLVSENWTYFGLHILLFMYLIMCCVFFIHTQRDRNLPDVNTSALYITVRLILAEIQFFRWGEKPANPPICTRKGCF
jgi:hypothetical protein